MASHARKLLQRILKDPEESATESYLQQSRACSGMTAGWCESICTHSEAKTFGQRPGVKKSSREATSLQEKRQGQTEILQEVQGLDSRRIVQSYFLWWSSLQTFWDIWKINFWSLHWNFGSVARQLPRSQSRREPVVSSQKASGQAEAHKLWSTPRANKARMDGHQSGFGPESNIQHARENSRGYEEQESTL